MYRIPIHLDYFFIFQAICIGDLHHKIKSTSEIVKISAHRNKVAIQIRTLQFYTDHLLKLNSQVFGILMFYIHHQVKRYDLSLASICRKELLGRYVMYFLASVADDLMQPAFSYRVFFQLNIIKA